nr:pre-mRNA-splicing factor cwc25-like [Aedes albopictus]
MLPEALLKRLAKRGIIQSDGQVNQQQPPSAAQSRHHSESSSDSDDDDDDDSMEDHRGGAGGDADNMNNEEIIAEDYDEDDQQANPETFEYPLQKKKVPQAVDWTEKIKQKMIKRYGFQSVDGCQNKYNVYHHCSMYCVKRYGEVEFEIEKDYEKRVKRLLERYPLPRHWRKEYDIGCKAFYFYNKETRIVSWLPPTHPDAKMTKSAKVLRKELMENAKNQENAGEGPPKAVIVESYPPPPKPPHMQPSREPMMGPMGETLKPPVVNPPKRPHHPNQKYPSFRDEDKRPRMAGGRSDRGGDRDYERDRERERDRDRDRDRDRRDRRGGDRRDDRRDRDRDRGDRDRGDRRGGKSSSGALDPMDPAAYSDIPRGTWASGLEAASGASKKEKPEKKEDKRKGPPVRDDDSEDEHEVLKVAPIQEFTQEDDDKDE